MKVKNNLSIITLAAIILSCICGISSDAPRERAVLEEFDVTLPEIGKAVKFEINARQFNAAPEWDGVDFKSIPVSMDKAVSIAKGYLSKNGCTVEKYYLYECSLVRLYAIEDWKQWYWLVSFGDASSAVEADPIIKIPVMLDGSVPDGKVSKLGEPRRQK